MALILVVALIGGIVATFGAPMTKASEDAGTWFTGSRSSTHGEPMHETPSEYVALLLGEGVFGTEGLALIGMLFGGGILTVLLLVVVVWLFRAVFGS